MGAIAVRHDPTGEPVDSVRAFNRFYTRRLGLLGAGLHDSRYSLPEVRVLYELAAAPGRSGSELARTLDLDLGYVSRLVKKLHAAGLVKKTPSPVDGRQNLLALTAKGVKVFTPIEQATREQIATMLGGVPVDQRDTLLASMRAIHRVLDPDQRAATQGYVIREPRGGDLGWIVHRQAALYAQEFGWDWTFEGMLAEIVAKFVKDFDATCERCWIAERDRRDRRWRVPGEEDQAGRATADALRRTIRARTGHRRATDRRVHRVRTREGLPVDGVVDQ